MTLRKAALAARGLSLLPIRLVAADLADGTLENVIPDCQVPDRPLYALHSPGGQTRAGSGCSSTSSPTGSAVRRRPSRC